MILKRKINWVTSSHKWANESEWDLGASCAPEEEPKQGTGTGPEHEF